jgi:hypothetical protein
MGATTAPLQFDNFFSISYDKFNWPANARGNREVDRKMKKKDSND